MPEADQPRDSTSFRAPGGSIWRDLKASSSASKEEQLKARNANDDLKNMLLASLQMQNLMVLAGSGCSMSAGGPSMGSLWTKAIGNDPTVNARETADKVNHDLNDPNIEAFLSRIEAFLQIHEDDGVRGFLNQSKQVILESCSRFLDSDRLGAHRTFLHRLSRRRARDQRLRVFTTNYDLCFERAAAELGGVALDGFSFTAPRRYDPRFFGYDIIRRPRGSDDLGHFLEGVFLLYKLHGSVNWARSADGAIYETDSPPPMDACLIYPATGKYQQSFLQPHLESMAQYLASVREPNTCIVVVGFGFNDDHLAEPLLAAVQSNPHLRLIVTDPGAKGKSMDGVRYWKEFTELSEAGEDVWFINSSFDDFAEMVPDLKSLTPANKLIKAIKGLTGE